MEKRASRSPAEMPIPIEEPEPLLNHDRMLLCSAGTVLYQQGESARGVYIVRNGTVALSVGSSQDKPVIIGRVSDGEMFGLEAALLGRPYEASATTESLASLELIALDEFMSRFQGDREFRFDVLRRMSENIERVTSRLRSRSSPLH